MAALIADRESVVLDSGTTCLEAARALRERPLTVMPLSLHAANALVGAPSLKLLLPGGEPRPGELAVTGPLAEASLAALRFDTAVIGCCGLTPGDGVTAYDLADAAIKRAAIASARRVIAVADAAKLSRTALAFVAAASSLDILVTDTDAPDESRRRPGRGGCGGAARVTRAPVAAPAPRPVTGAGATSRRPPAVAGRRAPPPPRVLPGQRHAPTGQ